MTLSFDYPGLSKIISGGQTGADQGGLRAAKHFNLQTGGTVPKGWRTVRGPMPELGELYDLVEHTTVHYFERTRINIQKSDGTVIIATNPSSPGSLQTLKYCKKHRKPVMILALQREGQAYSAPAIELAMWIADHRIETLNVAGNRDFMDNLHRDLTEGVLILALKRLSAKGLLVKSPVT